MSWVDEYHVKYIAMEQTVDLLATCLYHIVNDSPDRGYWLGRYDQWYKSNPMPSDQEA